MRTMMMGRRTEEGGVGDGDDGDGVTVVCFIQVFCTGRDYLAKTACFEQFVRF